MPKTAAKNTKKAAAKPKAEANAAKPKAPKAPKKEAQEEDLSSMKLPELKEKAKELGLLLRVRRSKRSWR